MQSKKVKIAVLMIFLAIVLGFGALFYFMKIKGHSVVRKKGYRTEYNPVYVDSMVRAKKNR